MSLIVGETARREAWRRQLQREYLLPGNEPPPPSAQRMRWMAEDEWLAAQWDLAGLEPWDLKDALTRGHP